MLQKLETIRDELKLQAHLFKEDLGQKIERFNDQWDGVRSTSQTARREVREATQLWAETVRKGYREIKKSLTK